MRDRKSAIMIVAASHHFAKYRKKVKDAMTSRLLKKACFWASI
jgi:hypothetical protein